MTDDYVLLYRAEYFYVIRELDTPWGCPYKVRYNKNMHV